MSGHVPEHIIRQIAHSVDFVGMVNRHCELKKSGRKFLALCPFHQEKTPSFTVDPEKGLYYCFGCKEGGNVFTFLQKTEGLDFGQALKKLAREAGVDLSPWREAEGPSRSEVERIRKINELAATYYQKCLQKAKAAERAREYLKERKISAESIQLWRLGYAPEGWDFFLSFAAKRDYPAELLERAGLVIAREDGGGHYDRFRNRLIFPIADGTGATIGFGARALSEDEQPKYINTPATVLFDKGSSFYGLANAREAVRAGGNAVIVEGYTDVIMAHQFGVAQTVAVLGTAFTQAHARVLEKLCGKVTLVFDADEAGEKSATRSLEILLGEDLDVAVTRLPGGQDPCEFLVERGGEAFHELLEGSEDFFEFRLKLASERHDLGTLAGRVAVFRDLAQLAEAVPDQAKWEMIVQQIAGQLGLSPASVGRYVEGRTARRARRPAPAAAAGKETLSADQLGAAELVGFLLVHPEFFEDARRRADISVLPDSKQKEVLEKLLDGLSEGESVDAGDFIGSLQDPMQISIASAAYAEEQHRRGWKTSLEQRLEGYLDYFTKGRNEEELARLYRATTTTPGSQLTHEQLARYLEQVRERGRKMNAEFRGERENLSHG